MNRNRMTKVALITATVAAVAVALAAIAWLLTTVFGLGAGTGLVGLSGRTVEVDRQESFPLSGLERIDLGTVSSDLLVRTGGEQSVSLRFHGSVRAASPEQVPELSTGVTGGTLRARIEHKPVVGFYGGSLRLEVWIPSGYQGRLAARSVSGDIELDDHLYSALEVRTTSGQMRLGRVETGSFLMRTTSGAFSARELRSAESELSTVSGDIAVQGFTGDLKAGSTSGKIQVGYAGFANRVQIRSVSGDVTLTLPEGAGFLLDARSTSGQISCAFPIRMEGAQSGVRHALRGQVGAADNPVSIGTVSGQIRIAR